MQSSASNLNVTSRYSLWLSVSIVCPILGFFFLFLIFIDLARNFSAANAIFDLFQLPVHLVTIKFPWIFGPILKHHRHIVQFLLLKKLPVCYISSSYLVNCGSFQFVCFLRYTMSLFSMNFHILDRYFQNALVSPLAW